MNFFIDTNLILDFLSGREPFADNANIIFNYAYNKKINLFVSSQSILTSHYILKKVFSEEKVRETLSEILEIIQIVPSDKVILQLALKSQHKDYEDGVQIFCAHKIENLEGIITRDMKDFSTSEIPVFAPDEALNHIKNSLTI
ncbi:PIN domain-containing protein [Chryseobacterium sp.]|uniref:type II toxin-antitoxin system VapC family toxin n=1 Tax=Chryseobacterium sp. TaxID=1871047 RepID=UPI0028A2774F|nr:PIN domain-containing protein [Chryseobacterium sp.]